MNYRYNRRSFVGRFCGALPLTAWAQQVRQPGMKRIGFLIGSEKALMDAFNNELRRLGYVEGKNIAVETRITRPNSPDNAKYAVELAGMDLVLVVVAALPGALELQKANPAMPMVIATCPGMVSNGFALASSTLAATSPEWTSFLRG